MNKNETTRVFLYKRCQTEFCVVLPSACTLIFTGDLRDTLGEPGDDFKMYVTVLDEAYYYVVILIDESQEELLRGLVRRFCEELSFSFVDHTYRGVAEQLAKSLVSLFIPHVADVTEYDSMVSRIMESDDDTAVKFKESTEEQKEEIKNSTLHCPTAITALGFWLPVLADSAREGVLDINLLDECMLPPGIKDSIDRLEEDFRAVENSDDLLLRLAARLAGFTPSDTEDFLFETLRRVRQSLPEGRKLPEDAERLLELIYDVTVA